MNTRKLAAILGVSKTTVVLALRNDPSISAETRIRVQQEARRLGYRRNPLVSALMAQVSQGRLGKEKGEVLAFLTAEPTEDGWMKWMHPGHGLVADLRRYAAQLGFRMDHFWLGPRGSQARRTAEILRARGVRGSILLVLPKDTPSLDLDWEHHPIVAHGHNFQGKPVHMACDDHFEGMKTCYRELRKLGYRRIGLALHPINEVHTRHRWPGAFATCPQLFGGKTLSFRPKKKWLHDDDVRKPFLAWFDRMKPDAIIGTAPNPALTWLGQIGLRAGRDYGYARLDIPTEQLGQIAGIRENHKAIAAALVDLLIEQLNANHYGLPEVPKLVEIEGGWVSGASVRSMN